MTKIQNVYVILHEFYLTSTSIFTFYIMDTIPFHIDCRNIDIKTINIKIYQFNTFNEFIIYAGI